MYRKLPSLKHFVPVKDSVYINRNKLAPQWPMRILLVGASGSGKTNLLLNLILQYLQFDRLFIYARDLNEDKYVFLQTLLKDEPAAEFSSRDDIISVDKLDPNQQNLLVFDDHVTTVSQKDIEDLF